MTVTGRRAASVSPADAEGEARRLQRARNQSVIDLLESWREVDVEEIREQAETLAMLKRAVNEDRLSDRDRFEIGADETMAATMNSAAPAFERSTFFEERRRRQIAFNRPAVRLLQSWLEDDAESDEEQRAGLEELKRSIDARRPSQKIFS